MTLVRAGSRCVCGHGPIMHVPDCHGGLRCGCRRFELDVEAERAYHHARSAAAADGIAADLRVALEAGNARRTSGWLFNQPTAAQQLRDRVLAGALHGKGFIP